MADPIIPASSTIVSSALNAITGLRPEATPYFNSGLGAWPTLPAMWRAQVLLCLARLGDEVTSARIRFATGDVLRQLAASEFNTTFDPTPQKTYATCALIRSTGTMPTGVIPKGFPFVKNANPNASPLPIAAASYVTTAAVYVPSGQTFALVNLQATTGGASGNIPAFHSTVATPVSKAIAPAQSLFDTNFTVGGCDGAGGTSGINDAALRAAAKAYAFGQYGPTDGALAAGVLAQQSVRHFAAFPATSAAPYAQVYVTDESWGSSPYWTGQIAQQFADNWQGFGCRARFGAVVNQQIAVAATIALASTDDLNFTDAIDASVRAAIVSYFNDRPDWYRWRSSSLQALISVADPRILQCTGVTVTDPLSGLPVPEPTSLGNTLWPASGYLLHYYPTNAGIATTYVPPS